MVRQPDKHAYDNARMKIIIANPPNFEEIDRAFKVAGKPVFFSYGNRIYNPMGVDIDPSLMAHESVHGERQGSDPEGWWKQYLVDPRFRFEEELPAHKAEYREFCRLNPTHKGKQDHALWQIASRLSGPLYGRLIKYSDAKLQISS